MYISGQHMNGHVRVIRQGYTCNTFWIIGNSNDGKYDEF